MDATCEERHSLEDLIGLLTGELQRLPITEKIVAINAVRRAIHDVSPFKKEPIDLVVWLPCEQVHANNYNPNTVAPPEMRLLKLSIEEDGYTQPIVTFAEAQSEIVDGFHRSRVGRETPSIRKRCHGHLPVTEIKTERGDRCDRIASTIRHNRARGTHAIVGMSSIVSDLYLGGWDDKNIAKELGMDLEEVTRLKQLTGLQSLFADRQFSKGWEPVQINELQEGEQ